MVKGFKSKFKSRYKSIFNKGKAQERFRPNDSTNTMGMKKWTGKRNKRDVWDVVAKSTKEAHFATYPKELIRPCIMAGSRLHGIVLDPFFGSGTTGIVAVECNRKYIGIELNPEYVEIAKKRIENTQLSFEGLI